MADWHIDTLDTYERAHKQYEKKHPNELMAVLDNLDRYFKTISHGVHPQFIVAGYIHNEPKGIKALDQKGGKGNLKQTRLYIYPDVDSKKLYLITIGDKASQKEDIRMCSDFVVNLKGVQNG